VRGHVLRAEVRQHQQELVLGFTQQREQRDHAALGRQQSVPLPVARRQRGDVIHRLGLQESRRITAGDAQEAMARQGGAGARGGIWLERHGGGT
jgi:hypothetical protein